MESTESTTGDYIVLKELREINKKSGKQRKDSDRSNNPVSTPWTHSIIKTIDNENLDVTLDDCKYIDYFVAKLIQDEGIGMLEYALGNKDSEDKNMIKGEFLWHKESKKQGLESLVKFCIYLLKIKQKGDYNSTQSEVSEEIYTASKKFLSHTIIALTINYMQNGQTVNFRSGNYRKKMDQREYLDKIWKLITDNCPIDDLFDGREYWNSSGKPRAFGDTNLNRTDREISQLKDIIGYQNWKSLDMSARETDEKIYHSPLFFESRLGRMPNRPRGGRKQDLVRNQYLNFYTFKLIDGIIRGKSDLEREDFILSGLIEEWIYKKLEEDLPMDKIYFDIIQTIYLSGIEAPKRVNLANASQGKIRKLLERDFGFSMKETPSENESEEEINFAFKIKSKQRKITKQEQKLIENAKQLEADRRIPGQVKKAKRRIEEQKNHDKKMNCKEQIAQILAYLPHLVALNGTYTIVQTKIEIPQLLGKELANLGNERLGKLDPNSKDSKYVLTLFPLNTNDDGLPIKDWYEKNFDLIRKLISDDGQGNQNLNKILAPQDQSYLLFKDNALPREYPLVHIAAMLDAGKESTEIKKQLLGYYPSLELLTTSDSPSKDECSNCGKKMDPEFILDICPYCKHPR